MKLKTFFLINKINKHLTRPFRKRRERTQINKVRHERGEIAYAIREIQKFIGQYYKQLYANKLDNLEKNISRNKQSLKTEPGRNK